MTRWILLTVLAPPALWIALAQAATPQPKFRELKPLMTEKGELLLSDSFTEESFKKNWRMGKGKWRIEEEAAAVEEVASDGHHPYVGHNVKVTDALVQFSFKFEGANSIFIGFDKPGEHICRLFLSPKNVRLTRTTGIGSTTKSTVIDEKPFEFEEGRWYSILVEVIGKEMSANIDNRCVLYGQIDGIEIPKTQLQLMSTGPTAWFDEVRVWEAKEDPNWPKRRPKLAAMAENKCK